jgi:lipoprotein-releasing system ATP-binding protein
MSDTTAMDVEVASTGTEERAPEQNPVLFLHDIERTYRQGEEVLHILRGAELAVWPGQSIALVAPSGAGKSTLLHIAGLLEQPDHGEVYVDGRATAALPD